MRCYAVAKGFKPGIYFSWYEAQEQTNGFSSPVFARFFSYTDAIEYLQSYEIQENNRLKQQVRLDAKIEIAGFQAPVYNYANHLFIGFQITPTDLSKNKIIKKFMQINLDNYTKDPHAAKYNAIIQAIETALSADLKYLRIGYTYPGIEKFVTEGWEAKNRLSQFYQTKMFQLSHRGSLTFEKQTNPNHELEKELSDYATQYIN